VARILRELTALSQRRAGEVAIVAEILRYVDAPMLARAIVGTVPFEVNHERS
jgi:hypothetical protein